MYFEASRLHSTSFVAHEAAYMSHKPGCGATALHKVRSPISVTGKPLSQGVGPLSQGVQPLSQGMEGLPQELTDAVEGLGKRASPPGIRKVIRQLCGWKPLSSDEIAKLPGRDQAYLARTYLTPVFRDGELAYTIPDTPSHKDQKYRGV